MSRVDAFLCLIGVGLFFHGLYNLLPSAAEIAGGLFLVGAATHHEPIKEGRG